MLSKLTVVQGSAVNDRGLCYSGMQRGSYLPPAPLGRRGAGTIGDVRRLILHRAALQAGAQAPAGA